MEYEFAIEGDYYDGPVNGDAYDNPYQWCFFETPDLIDDLNGENGTTLLIYADDLEAAVQEARERLGALASAKYSAFSAVLWWQNPPDAPCKRVHEWN